MQNGAGACQPSVSGVADRKLEACLPKISGRLGGGILLANSRRVTDQINIETDIKISEGRTVDSAPLLLDQHAGICRTFSVGQERQYGSRNVQ